jgi:lipopolysaccharide export system permease protein
MNILTRYIISELLKWFLLSLTVLTLIILIFFVAREAIRRGLPLLGVMRLIPYFLPIALGFAVPGTLLLATTSVYGRLASWNEIVAIKAQGISPRKLLEPIWALAFIASLVTVLLNDKAVSWGRNGVHHVLIESVEQIMYGRLSTHRQYSAGRLAINVKGVVGRKLIRPTVSFRQQGTLPTITFTADEAELKKDMDQGEEVLKIVFRHGSVDFGTEGSMQFSDEPFEWFIALQDASQTGDLENKASCLPLRLIPDETIRQKAAIDRRERNLAAQAACQMICGDLDGLTDEEWDSRVRSLRFDHERLYRLRAEPHRRWSAGFSCLCFAFVGAPMAILLRNRDLLTSFFLCFLPILIVWYPLLLFGDGAKDGRLPPWSAWSGNVLLLLCGSYLLRKVIRY